MKFSFALAILVAASSAYALKNSIIASRQHHARRGLVDICVALDLDLELLDILPDGQPLITGHLDVCLCLSLVPDFIEVNPAARRAVNVLDKAKVTALLDGLIRTAPGRQTCHYPPHASPVCDAKNLCKFECNDGYQPLPSDNPTSCICSAPDTECNGKCGSFPNGCGSSVPARKRNLPQCAFGRELCSVPGSSTGKKWECVHTKRDSESCGGCLTPSDNAARTGVDCSMIANVANVICDDGKCIVKKCKSGFVPSPSADACVLAPVHGDELDTFIAEKLKLVIDNLTEVNGKVVAGVHVGGGLDAFVAQNLKLIIDHLAEVKEKVIAGVHVGRGLDALVVEKLKLIIDHLTELKEKIVAGVHVGPGLDGFVAEEIKLIIDSLAEVKGKAVSGVHVGRR